MRSSSSCGGRFEDELDAKCAEVCQLKVELSKLSLE